jgi:hypothetical protein
VALDIETCQIFVALDIEGAIFALGSLSLSSYHGENVTDCATEVKCIIKFMQVDMLFMCQQAHLFWVNLLICPVNPST